MIFYTLIPSDFFVEAEAAERLSELFPNSGPHTVKYVGLPFYKAVLVYGIPVASKVSEEESFPEVYKLLMDSRLVKEHNKILVDFEPKRNEVHMVIAEGDELKMCNTFPASDFVTAEYFIFSAIRLFQFNPEMSNLYFESPLTIEEREALLEYFHGAEQTDILMEQPMP
ncbi:MAG: DUF3822 family protein [Bacteroidales bacterium]|nr:DUF3822 family protein [Bacteroidales bacterium]MCI2122493.1 DUF3822 family protein [Bacteroidales bacterium]MCI2145478.1 DUF3822 family protein [Bacteroidales bacterium]